MSRVQVGSETTGVVIERCRDLFERKLIAREAIEQAEEAETLARAAVERARSGRAIC